MAHVRKPPPSVRRRRAAVALLIAAALAGGAVLLLTRAEDDGAGDARQDAERSGRATATAPEPAAPARRAPAPAAPTSTAPAATAPPATSPAGTAPSPTAPSAAPPAASAPSSAFLAATDAAVDLARPAYARAAGVLAGMRAKTYDPTRARPDASFALARHEAALARARALPAGSAAEREARGRLTTALERAVAHDRDVLAVAALYGTEAVGPFAAAMRRAESSAAAAAAARASFGTALDRLRSAA